MTRTTQAEDLAAAAALGVESADRFLSAHFEHQRQETLDGCRMASMRYVLADYTQAEIDEEGSLTMEQLARDPLMFEPYFIAVEQVFKAADYELAAIELLTEARRHYRTAP